MGGRDLLEQLREKAAELPDDGPPLVLQARRRPLKAVDTVAAALRVDPTLAAEDRCWTIDLLNELLRQIKPLARQVSTDQERRRLAALPGTREQIARLGRTNPHAAEELDALSQRCTVLADQIIRTGQRRPRCAGPGCDRELDHAATGRPRRYCGAACRQRARRATTATG